MPFFVGLQLGNGGDAQTDGASSKPATSFIPASMTSSRNYVVRSGSPATLQLDSEHVHIRLSVICLENGAAGQTIRVTGKDRRLVFSAQVIDGGTCRGGL